MTSGRRGTDSRGRPGKGKPRGEGGRAARRRRGGPASETRRSAFGLGLPNLLLLTAAAASIVAGYVLLDRGSVTAAPLLLVLGYVVLIPAGLLVGWRRNRDA